MEELSKLKYPMRLFAFSIIASLIMLELALSFLDPVGVHRMYNDIRHQGRVIVPHPTGYSYETGYHDWLAYDVTMLADGLRFVPDTVLTSDCRIAFIGDSFTFGQGVNDSETFANLTAREFRVNVLNTGRNGYNARQALRQADYYQADLYVYLAIANDNQQDVIIERSNEPYAFGLETYLSAIQLNIAKNNQAHIYEARAQENMNVSTFEQALHALQLRENVFIFTFEGVFEGYGLTPIPDFGNHYVSLADKHPNAEGHAIIFNSMRPYIREAISEFCLSLCDNGQRNIAYLHCLG